MSAINEMHKVLLKKNSKIRFGTHADPKVITLGPKKGGKPGFKPYKGKHSLDIDMPLDTPILAPIDMTFIGFKNNSAKKHKKFIRRAKTTTIIYPNKLAFRVVNKNSTHQNFLQKF